MSLRVHPTGLSTPPAGSVLVLAPHPDDEVIGVGGTLALHAAQGDEVHVVVAFDGCAGCPEEPETLVRERRRAEAREGGLALSSGSVALTYQFLDFEEGHEPTQAELSDAAALLGELIGERCPSTVYAPWPGDGHRDHHSLAMALMLALSKAPAGRRPERVLGYEVWSPLEASVLMDVTPVIGQKKAALACHVSQDGAGNLTHRSLGLGAWRSSHAGIGCRYAEALRPYPPIARVQSPPVSLREHAQVGQRKTS